MPLPFYEYMGLPEKTLAPGYTKLTQVNYNSFRQANTNLQIGSEC